jgi:hypothetical protein
MQGLGPNRAVNTTPRLYTTNRLVYKAQVAGFFFPESYTKHTDVMWTQCRIFNVKSGDK